MLVRSIQILLVFSLIAIGYVGVSAQLVPPDRNPFSRRGEREEVPKAVQETRERMRIEKEKKDYDEMIERGEEVQKLSEQVEKSFAANGRLSDKDKEALESIEKNVKKIRNELGGDDDDESIDEVLGERKDVSVADVIGTFATATASLVDELKKSTRFTISATAIQSSNAVLKLVRFLRQHN